MAGRRQTFLLRAKSWQVTCSGTVTSLASAWRSVRRSVALRARRPRAMSVDDRLQRSDAAVPLDDVIAEAQRAFSICNACRYCEGYCAVFPALERRLSFANPARFMMAFSDAEQSFYAIVPHGIMVGVFGAVFAFVVVALTVSILRFRTATEPRIEPSAQAPSIVPAARDAATLKYLDGG